MYHIKNIYAKFKHIILAKQIQYGRLITAVHPYDIESSPDVLTERYMSKQDSHASASQTRETGQVINPVYMCELTVSPDVVLVLPHTNTLRGATLATACSIYVHTRHTHTHTHVLTQLHGHSQPR